MNNSILVVEDEADLRALLCFNLQREGYACRCVSDGATALSEIRRHAPDLIVLDRMLPGQSGDHVASQLQRDPQWAAIPILMLTAKGEEADQLVGFALGASDYVTKPFSMKVLLARIAAALRRAESGAEPPQRLSRGPLALDLGRVEVTVDEKLVPLTNTEFRILHALMVADGRVLGRQRLIDAVLGTTAIVTDRTIDVHIVALRRKLGDAAAWVQTIRGVGYSFRRPAGEPDP